MNNTELISSMFEDLKGVMTSINKKLDHHRIIEDSEEETTPVSVHSINEKTSKNENDKREEVNTQKFISFIYKAINNALDGNVHKYQQSLDDQMLKLNAKLDDVTKVVVRLNANYKKRRLQFKKLVAWQIIVAISVLFNVHLVFEDYKLRDNDLKFKYIQACHGISADDLARLDTVFHVNRNEQMIEQMRAVVKRR